jgi:hypothetical protein
MWGYGQATEPALTARGFWIDVVHELQKYKATAKPGILIGNWSEAATAFERSLRDYLYSIGNDHNLLQARDLTIEFADSLQSTYHAVTSPFIGGWLADTLSMPFGGGGSSLKKSIIDVLKKYEPLFKRAEECIQKSERLEQERQASRRAQEAYLQELERLENERQASRRAQAEINKHYTAPPIRYRY